MSEIQRAGKLAAVATAIAVGTAAIGGGGAVAANEGRFQAIVQPGSMPSRLLGNSVLSSEAAAHRLGPRLGELSDSEIVESTPEEEVSSTLGMLVNLGAESQYFQTFNERLFNNPGPFFRVTYALNDQDEFVSVESMYFQDGMAPIVEEGVMPDVRVAKNYDDGNGFHGSFEVDFLVRPDGTLGGTIEPDYEYTKEQIHEFAEKFFILPPDWELDDWGETEGGATEKSIRYDDAFIAIGGYPDTGAIYFYFQVLNPDEQNAVPNGKEPTPTLAPDTLA